MPCIEVIISKLLYLFEKFRLIYVKGSDDDKRHPKMRSLVDDAAENLIRKCINSPEELIGAVYASLVKVLEDRELIGHSAEGPRAGGLTRIPVAGARGVGRFALLAHGDLVDGEQLANDVFGAACMLEGVKRETRGGCEQGQQVTKYRAE